MLDDHGSFEMKTMLHPGSVPSPLLFSILMDVVTKETKRSALGVAVCR